MKKINITALIFGAVFFFLNPFRLAAEEPVKAKAPVTEERLAAQKEESTGEVKPVDCFADHLEYDEVNGALYGKGNVKVIYKGTEIKADEVRFNVKSSELEANGNITVTENDMVIKGEFVKFNMKGKVGRIEKIDLSKGPWYFKGSAVEKPDEKNATLIEGYATTCQNREHPHYRLVSQRIHIELDNIIESWSVLLYVGDIPVFYFPYIWKSLKTSAKSPLDIKPGYSSSEGLYLKLAYNYELSEYFTGALQLDLMQKKGSGYGLQQNYRFADGLNGGYLYAYYVLEQDTLHERFRVDFDHSSRFNNNLSVVARLNYLSDEALTRDFYSYDYPVVSRDIRSYFATTYYDSLFSVMLAVDRQDHYDPFDRLYRLSAFTLPNLRFNTTSLRIGETTAYWSLASEIMNYYSAAGGYYILQSGLHPGLSYSLKLDQLNSLNSSFSLNAVTQDHLEPNSAAKLSSLNYAASFNLHTTWNMNMDTDVNYSYSESLSDVQVLTNQVNGRLNLRVGNFLSSTMNTSYFFLLHDPDLKKNFGFLVDSTNFFFSQDINAAVTLQYSIPAGLMNSLDVFSNFGRPQGFMATFGLNYIKADPASPNPDLLDISGSVAFNISEDMHFEYGTRYNTVANDFREHRFVFSANLTDCWCGGLNFTQSYGIFSFGLNLQLRAFKESPLDKKLSPEVYKK